MKRFFIYKWAIAWAIVMLTLFLIPSSDINPPTSFQFQGSDKLVHCGLFFIFASLLLAGEIRASKKVQKLKSGFIVLLIGAFFALLTEGAQYFFTDSRSAQWEDVFADLMGTGMAIFAFFLFYLPYVKWQK